MITARQPSHKKRKQVNDGAVQGRQCSSAVYRRRRSERTQQQLAQERSAAGIIFLFVVCHFGIVRHAALAVCVASQALYDVSVYGC